MRVLFVTFPWRSHLNLVVPLGWAMQAAGHEVRVASGPELTDVITESGLTAVAVGSHEPVFAKVDRAQSDMLSRIAAEHGSVDDLMVDMAENRAEVLTWDRLRWLYRFLGESFKAMNDSMVEDLVRHCRRWQPDLVVWDTLSYAGSIAATSVGAAHARMPTAIDVESRMRRHYLRVRAQQPPEEREDPLADWLGGWAARYGAAFTEDMVTGQFTIDQMVESLRPPSGLPSVLFRYVPYNGPSVVPDWARGDPARRRVLATFGVSLEKDSSAFALQIEQVQGMLDALADLDIELVLTLPERLQEGLRRVPGNTRVVEFVPLHVVIPSCSAVIHHGGVNTFLDAIAHGLPQLIVGRVVTDLGERGPRLTQAGAGMWLPGDEPEELSGPRIRDQLVRLLDEPAFRAGAGRLRDEMVTQPTPAGAVAEIERLAGSVRP